MTATTVVIPTLAWVLPLMLVVCLAWAWGWRRWVMPLVRRGAERWAIRGLQSGAGLSAEQAAARIEEWKREGWLE